MMPFPQQETLEAEQVWATVRENSKPKEQILGLSAQAWSSCGLGLSRRFQWEAKYDCILNKEYVKVNQRAILRIASNCPNVREIKQHKGN